MIRTAGRWVMNADYPAFAGAPAFSFTAHPGGRRDPVFWRQERRLTLWCLGLLLDPGVRRDERESGHRKTAPRLLGGPLVNLSAGSATELLVLDALGNDAVCAQAAHLVLF